MTLENYFIYFNVNRIRISSPGQFVLPQCLYTGLRTLFPLGEKFNPTSCSRAVWWCCVLKLTHWTSVVHRRRSGSGPGTVGGEAGKSLAGVGIAWKRPSETAAVTTAPLGQTHPLSLLFLLLVGVWSVDVDLNVLDLRCPSSLLESEPELLASLCCQTRHHWG